MAKINNVNVITYKDILKGVPSILLLPPVGSIELDKILNMQCTEEGIDPDSLDSYDRDKIIDSFVEFLQGEVKQCAELCIKDNPLNLQLGSRSYNANPEYENRTYYSMDCVQWFIPENVVQRAIYNYLTSEYLDSLQQEFVSDVREVIHADEIEAVTRQKAVSVEWNFKDFRLNVDLIFNLPSPLSKEKKSPRARTYIYKGGVQTYRWSLTGNNNISPEDIFQDLQSVLDALSNDEGLDRRQKDWQEFALQVFKGLTPDDERQLEKLIVDFVTDIQDIDTSFMQSINTTCKEYMRKLYDCILDNLEDMEIDDNVYEFIHLELSDPKIY